MHKSIIFITLVILPSVSFGANHTVEMKSISYAPKKIEIKVGDTLEWKNSSLTEHSAIVDSAGSTGTFDTGMVQPGKTSKRVDFNKAGTYQYHCSVHGKTMSGTVTVVP